MKESLTLLKSFLKIPSFYCQQLSMRIYRSNNAGNRYRTFHKRSSLFRRRNGRFLKDKRFRMLIDRNHLSSPVYVGDTQGDADACHAAGIPFIFAEYGFGMFLMQK